MRRNPIYVFKDLEAVGINNVPIGSTIQINDADDLTPGSQPLLVQVIAKDGIISGSTIRDFLANESNYTNASDTTEIHSELEKIVMGANQGWRLLGVDETKYGAIGEKAVDLSIVSTGATMTYGATGDNSFTVGRNVKASGVYSVAVGEDTLTSVEAGFVAGKFNVGADVTNIVEVGIGISDSERKNGLEINLDGTMTIPYATVPAIEGKTEFAVATKGYVQYADSFKVAKSGDTMTGDLIIDEANLRVQKDSGGANGDVIAEGSIKIGTGSSNQSTIAFNAAGVTPGGQKLYFDNIAAEFKLDTSSAEGYTIWHSGNDGMDSGLDADKLDGLEPNELPVSDRTQTELDLKFDKVGGAISGDVAIATELSVQGATALTGDLSLGNVASTVTFKEDATFERNVQVDGVATAGGVTIKTDINGDSKISFTDLDNPMAVPAVYWNNNTKQVELDTLLSTGNVIWNEENFDPDSKLNIIGGSITGNLGISGTLGVQGTSTFTGAIVGSGNLNVGGASTLATLTAQGAVQAQNTLTVAGATTINNVLAVNDAAFVTGPTTLGGNATVGGTFGVTGATTLSGDATVVGTLNVGTDVVVSGSGEVVGEFMVGGSIITGTDSNSNSSFGFTDVTGTNTPTLFWNNTERDFYVDLNSSVNGDEKLIWHAGNFDPTDPSIVPRSFDDLTDTPAVKIADKYLKISSDGLRVSYVDVPDVAAIWGNISGTLSNQSDLQAALDTKYNSTGGTITGNVQVNGASTFDNLVTVAGNLIAMNNATFQEDVVFQKDISLTGNLDVSQTLEVAGATTLQSALTVLGDITATTNATIEGDLNVLSTTTFQGAVTSAGSHTINGNFRANLATTLVGAVDMQNVLSVASQADFGADMTVDGSLDVGGDVDVVGSSLFHNDVQINGGDLVVSGDSTFSSDLSVGTDLSVSQNATISGNLTLGGASSDLTVSNNATIGGEFRAQDISEFTGDATFSADVLVQGLQTVEALQVNTTANIDSGLTVGGVTDLGSAVNVIGILTTSADVELGEDLHVVATSNLDGTVTTLADVNVGTDLDVGQDLTVAGVIDSTGAITGSDTLNIAGVSTLVGNIFASSSASIVANLSVGGDTTVTGVINANGGVSASTLATIGNATIGGDFDVQGATTLVDATLGSDLTVGGNTAMTGTLDVTSTSQFNDDVLVDADVTINNDLTVGGNTAITGNTSVTGNTAITGTLDVTAGTTLTTVDTTDINATGDVAVVGTMTLNGDDVATIDTATGKIYTNLMPELAITNVHVVADIAARDALVTTPGVQTGDVAKVTDSVADTGVNKPQTYIYDGSAWIDIQETSDVVSVAGYTGVVTLDTADIAENSGFLYYTEARVDANIATKDTADLAEGTNLYYTEARVDANIATKDTADLAEGTNLYFTAVRAQAEADTQIAAAVGVSVQAYSADTVVDATYVATANDYTNADKAKVDFISVTGAIDLDTVVLDGDIGVTVQAYSADTVVDANYVATANDYTNADEATVGFITVTGAVDLDAIDASVTALEAVVPLGGDTASRPVDPELYTTYFDTDLVSPRPIWCSDNTNGANVWVDATGTTV